MSRATVGAMAATIADAFPPQWAESWDRVGLLAGDPAAPAEPVLVALDATLATLEAARAIGVPTYRIIFSHVVPNLLGIVVIYTSITVPGVILTESVLSFLGLGVQEPMTSWGVLIHDGANVMESSPWMIWFPGAALTLTLYCANFLGDGMRDALDPKSR